MSLHNLFNPNNLRNCFTSLILSEKLLTSPRYEVGDWCFLSLCLILGTSFLEFLKSFFFRDYNTIFSNFLSYCLILSFFISNPKKSISWVFRIVFLSETIIPCIAILLVIAFKCLLCFLKFWENKDTIYINWAISWMFFNYLIYSSLEYLWCIT